MGLSDFACPGSMWVGKLNIWDGILVSVFVCLITTHLHTVRVACRYLLVMILKSHEFMPILVFGRLMAKANNEYSDWS